MVSEVRVDYKIGAKDLTRTGISSALSNLNKLKTTAAGLSRVLGGLGVGLSAAGFASFAKSGIDAADAAFKAAQKIGLTTEQLTRYQYAAELGGASAQTFQAALIKLSSNVDKAAGGQKAYVEQFERLGIAVTDVAGNIRPTADVFEDLADKLSKLPDGATKTRVAMQLLGRSGAELIPTLNGGSEGLRKLGDEAERLGIVIDSKTAKAAEAFNDNLERVGRQAEAVKISLISELLPALGSIADEMARAALNGEGFLGVLKGIGAGVIRNIEGSELEQLARLQKLQKEAWETLKATLAAGDQAAIRTAQERLTMLTRRIEGLKVITEKAAARPEDKPRGLTRNDVDEDTAAQTAAAKEAERLAKAALAERNRLTKAQADFVAGLERQLELEKDSTEEARVRFELTKGEGVAFSAASKEKAIALAREIDLMKESAEVQEEMAKMSVEREEEAVKAAESLAVKRLSVIESLRTPVEEYAARVRELSLLGLDNETLQRGISEARAEMDAANESLKKTDDTARELGLTFESALENALVDFKSLRDVLDSLEKDLLRIGTRKLVIEPLIKAGSDFLGGGGSGGGIGGAISGLFGKLFAGGKAAGGPVSAGRMYRVGEMGPELLMMGAPGRVVPATAGGVSVSVTYNHPPRNEQERASAMQVAASAGRQVQKALARNG